MDNKLYNQDCMEVLPQLEDKSVDMILCDLPYGTTASKWDKILPMDKLWEQYWRLLKPNGSVVLFASGQFVPRLMMTALDFYKYMWIWIKRNGTNFVHAKNRPLTKHECILVFSKAPMGHKSLLGNNRMTYNPQGIIDCHKEYQSGKNKFGTIAYVRPSHKKTVEREYTNYPSDILMDFPKDKPSLHTNQKPVALLEYLIKTYTNEGDTVLDNCMGVGSTGVACVRTNRNFIGIEIDKKYFDIAQQRISQQDLA